jgi:hypothetical protein
MLRARWVVVIALTAASGAAVLLRQVWLACLALAGRRRKAGETTGGSG